MDLSTPNQGPAPHQAAELAQSLDSLLSGFQVFQGNVQQAWWNPQLRLHFDLAPELGRVYQGAGIGANALAERIVDLGGAPTPAGSRALVLGQVQPVAAIHSYDDAVRTVVHDCKALAQSAREIAEKALSYRDEQTAALMAEMIKHLLNAAGLFAAMRLAKFN